VETSSSVISVNLQPALDGHDRRYARRLRGNWESPVAEVVTGSVE
jgi:hypothetical protein